MTVVKHVLNRIHVQRLLLAAALFGFSLSASANFIARTTHGNFEIVKVGKTTELRPPQTVMGNGNAVASTGTVTQGMGATAGGSTAASGVNLAGTTTVPVNGSNVPVAVKTNVTSDVLIPAALGALGCASGGVAGAVVCGAAAVAAPLALNWLANSGGRINPATKQLEVPDPSRPLPQPSDGYKWQLSGGPAVLIYNSPGAACAAYLSYVQTGGVASWGPWTLTDCTPTVSGGVVVTGVNNPNPDKRLRQTVAKTTQSNGCALGNYVDTAGKCVSDLSGYYLPASMDDIAPYMRKVPVDPGIVKEVTDAGRDLGNPPLQVSGPSSVPGPTTTNITNNTTNNTSTTTTTSTTNNYTYEGNKVTNTGSTINGSKTVTTTNPDGTKTTTTETTTGTTTPGEPAPPDEPKVQCDKYPNSLGCAEMDVPDGEIPKDTKNVTFTAEDPFGGGRCPVDVMASFRAIGNQSLKIVDWATFCGYALPLRGLVLALASIMAFFIIMPGGVRE